MIGLMAPDDQLFSARAEHIHHFHHHGPGSPPGVLRRIYVYATYAQNHFLVSVSSRKKTNELEAINRLGDTDNQTITMNKFLSFLVAVLAVAQASAFMGQPVFGQQRVVRNLVAMIFEFSNES
jgi:hypothetical protein